MALKFNVIPCCPFNNLKFLPCSGHKVIPHGPQKSILPSFQSFRNSKIVIVFESSQWYLNYKLKLNTRNKLFTRHTDMSRPRSTREQAATYWKIRLVKGPIVKVCWWDTLSIKDRDSMFPGYLKNSTIPLFPKSHFKMSPLPWKKILKLFMLPYFPKPLGVWPS